MHAISRTETEEPKRAKVLNDIAAPNCTFSSTDKDAPMRDDPTIETAAPSLAHLRSDMEEDTVA
jgi:hypothetical protein